ncbi:hypothetical protein ABPG74_006842, partial [Tetrahymena malaccensis]
MTETSVCFYKLKDFLKSTLQTHRNLEINLSGDQFDDRVMSIFSNAIVKCKQLSILGLYLSECNINDNRAQIIGSFLQSFAQLTKLTLKMSQNNLSHQGVLNLVSGLKQCTRLTTLSIVLNKNQIGDEAFINLTLALGQCKSLTTLSIILHQNWISTKVVYLGNSLKNLINLYCLEIDLNNNNFGEIAASRLGNSFKLLPKIKSLNLIL